MIRLLLITLLIAITRVAFGGVPEVGEYLTGNETPKGCTLFNFFSLTEGTTPTLTPVAPEKQEFSIYRLFVCPSSRHDSSLVIWRTRHHQHTNQPAEQLVGVLTVKPQVLRKALARNSVGKPSYNLISGSCFLRNNGLSAPRVNGYGVVNAILDTTSPRCEPIHRRHMIAAWRVDGEHMALIPVDPSEILDCDAPCP
jgi:hypothetical protein